MNTKPIRLIMHIGQPKTGTSAIQGFLNFNRQKLANEYGIVYPNFNRKDFIFGRQHNHAGFFLRVLDEDSIKSCESTFGKLKKYCLDNYLYRIVISNEGFFSYKWPKYLKELIEYFNFDYHIILYLRRQDKYIESAWKQWGHKSPLYNTINDYLDEINLDWKQVINVWLENFDKGKFTVRPYEKSSIGNDIVADFMKILDVKELSNFVSPPKSNQVQNFGFNRDIIEVLTLSKSIVNSQHDNGLLDLMYKTVSERYQKKPFEEYDFLSPKDKLKIIEKYEESNKQIAKIFFGKQADKLFNDPLPDPNDSWKPYEGMTTEKLVSIITEIQHNQHKEINSLRNASGNFIEPAPEDFWKPYKGLIIEEFVPNIMKILYNQQKEIESLRKPKRNEIKEKVKNSNLYPRVNLMNRLIYKKSLFQKQIIDVKLEKDGIFFTVDGHDPHIILPNLKILKTSKQVMIDITVPKNTSLCIYYKTKRSKHYSKKRFIKAELSTGRNTVVLDIPSNEIIGRLRFDPGTLPGNYILHRISCLGISSFLIFKSLRSTFVKIKKIINR